MCGTTELYTQGSETTCLEYVTAAQLKPRGITSHEDAVQLEDRGRDDGRKFNGVRTGQNGLVADVNKF
jgi:hypothetical protein